MGADTAINFIRSGEARAIANYEALVKARKLYTEFRLLAKVTLTV